MVDTNDTREPVKPPPLPVHAFPSAPEHVPPDQQDPVNAILDALAEKVARLKQGLEAILANPSMLAPREPEPETTRTKVEWCKFCRSRAHLEEECEEADKYILAGKCKRNVFGRLTLPSGADVPPWLRGKTLQERFDKYHSQCPGQQADPARHT